MPRTRKQNAEELAIAAVVFVRKARKNGYSNLITVHTILEMAEERGIDGNDYSVRTVKTLIRQSAQRQNETHLIDF
jgi:hypothetical protein